MGLNISTDPNQLKKMLFNGAGANPLYPSPDASAPAPPTAPPASGAIASAMPAPAPLTQPPPSATPTFQPPQSKEEYLGQHPAILPPRPVGDFDPGTPHPKLRSALAALFAGMAEFGRPGSGMAMANRWADQTAAERAYDTNLPAVRQKAENEQYETYLHGAEQGAGIQHTQAETKNLQQNVPMLQHQQQFLDKVRTLKESGKYSSDEDLFNAMLPEAATIPGMNRQQIVDAINSSKTLGAKYQIQQDKNGRPEFATDRQGNRIFPDAKGKLPDPELQQQWDSISQTHQQGISEEENKEKRVAGYAADRQAQGYVNAQQTEARKQLEPRVNTALDADERLSRMERAYQKGVKGDQQAMLSLLTDHIGMTLGMQKGARITKDILNEAQNSQPWLSKIAAKFNGEGYLSGAALGPDQMKQMLDLGYEARDRAYGSARDASTTYGIALPRGFEKVEGKRQPGAKPALETKAQSGPPKGSTHTGVSSIDGKKYYLDAQGKKLGPAE